MVTKLVCRGILPFFFQLCGHYKIVEHLIILLFVLVITNLHCWISYNTYLCWYKLLHCWISYNTLIYCWPLQNCCTVELVIKLLSEVTLILVLYLNYRACILWRERIKTYITTRKISFYFAWEGSLPSTVLINWCNCC